MVHINGKNIDDVLTDGMVNGLSWLAPFNYKHEPHTEMFLDANEPVVFDETIKRTNIPNNVKYLPYENYCIVFVNIHKGEAAVSGKFSGCYMGTYWENDVKKVCHIATGAGTEGCVEKFDQLNRPGKIKFKPTLIIYDVKDKNEIIRVCKEKGFDFNPYDDVYGIITYEDELYSFIVAKKDNKYFVMAWAEWEIQNNTQILKSLFAKFDELYPYLTWVQNKIRK